MKTLNDWKQQIDTLMEGKLFLGDFSHKDAFGIRKYQNHQLVEFAEALAFTFSELVHSNLSSTEKLEILNYKVDPEHNISFSQAVAHSCGNYSKVKLLELIDDLLQNPDVSAAAIPLTNEVANNR